MKMRCRLSWNGLAIVILYAYLALNSIGYIAWIPAAFTSYALYGFVIVSLIAMLKSSKLYLSTHVQWYAVFIIACLISVLYSSTKNDSLNVISQQVKILIFMFCFTNMVNTKRKLKNALVVLSCSTIILFVYLYSTNQLMLENERLGNTLTGNANTFAHLFMVGAFCSVFFILYAEKRCFRALFLVFFIVQEFSIALSGGRKYFILPVVIYLALYILSKDAKGRRHFLTKGIIAVGLFIAVYHMVMRVQILYNTIGYRFEGLLNGLLGTGKFDNSAQGRFDLIGTAIELWRDSPLWGNGINSFKTLSFFGGFAHNNYVELLCGIGLLGTAIYYTYFLLFLRRYQRIKAKGESKYYWLFLSFVLLAYDYGAVSYYDVPAQILLMLLPLGITLLGEEGVKSLRNSLGN